MADCRLTVRVTPRGGADRIDSVETGEAGRPLVRLRVRAAPADGQANTAVLVVLAKALGVPKSRLSLTGGASARVKTIAVEGLALQEALSRLLA